MIAFLFPGQGSQRPGMGRPWVDVWPDLFDLASEAAGKDVRRLVCEADADELERTDNAQLATFACSVAALRSLTQAGLGPAVVAGHSLGEYSALVAAGLVTVDDGTRLVVARGEGMRAAADSKPGTMAALVGCDQATAEKACADAATAGVVVVANVNAADQVVVSGESDAVAEAISAAKRLGVRRALPLKVGGAFHSPLMAAALERLDAAIEAASLADATTPLVANVDAQTHTKASEIAPLLRTQLCAPVLWQASFDTLLGMGIRGFVEVGAGGVLSKLAKRAAPGSVVTAVATPEDAAVAGAALAGLAETSATSLQPPAAPPFEAVPDMIDRPIVAPARGRFRLAVPSSPTADAEVLDAGQLVGEVVTPEGRVPVRSRLRGLLVHVLTRQGEQVEAGQPLVTVRPF